jgi:hypothetical protein
VLRVSSWSTARAVETPIEPDLVAPAPRSAPADVRELRAVRYGSRRD